MIKILLLTTMLSCPNVIIKNLSPTWNKDDQEVLTSAKKRCGEIYPEAPCLKVFIKKEDRLYNAICGAVPK